MFAKHGVVLSSSRIFLFRFLSRQKCMYLHLTLIHPRDLDWEPLNSRASKYSSQDVCVSVKKRSVKNTYSCRPIHGIHFFCTETKTYVAKFREAKLLERFLWHSCCIRVLKTPHRYGAIYRYCTTKLSQIGVGHFFYTGLRIVMCRLEKDLKELHEVFLRQQVSKFCWVSSSLSSIIFWYKLTTPHAPSFTRRQRTYRQETKSPN